MCDTRLSFLFLNQIITFYNIVETHQLHSIFPPPCIITKTDIRNIDKKQIFVLCKYFMTREHVKFYHKIYICKLVESFQLCKMCIIILLWLFSMIADCHQFWSVRIYKKACSEKSCTHSFPNTWVNFSFVFAHFVKKMNKIILLWLFSMIADCHQFWSVVA